MIHTPLPTSFSKINLYERCALQYKFRHVDGLETEKAPQAARGTAIHASIEGNLKGEKTTLHRAATYLFPIVREAKANNARVEHKIAFNRAFKLVKWKDPLAYFRLVIDSWFVSNATAHIQEWKSGKMYDDHADQRAIYGMGAILSNPVVDNAVVTTHYLDLKKDSAPLLMDTRQATLTAQALAERVARLEREKLFVPRPGYYCSWCPYSRHKGGPCPIS